MIPTKQENENAIPGFVKYVRVIMGLAIILIGSFSFYHFIFDNPSSTNEQGSFLYSMFYTLFIASGIWLIFTRNKPAARNLSKSRLYRSLIIMIGVILALVAVSFFFG